MAERNDDIKQLFSHLGLNPGDYQEMRVPPRVVGPTTETTRGPNTRAAAVSGGRANVDMPRTYTRTPASIRPLPSLPPPAMPKVAPTAVERSPLLSFFEAVKEPISTPPVAPLAPSAIDPKTEANRAVTDRMIQDIKDISRRISRDVVPPPKSRWADIADISKPLDKSPPRVSPTVRPSAPISTPVAGPVVARVATPPIAETPRLKLKFGAAANPPDASGGESLKDIFDRLAGGDSKNP